MKSELHKIDFEDALNHNPMKVVKLSWVIVGVCCIVFGFVASGYFYWDARLNETQKNFEQKLNSVEDKVNLMDKTVNVIDTKMNYSQRDIEEIKKNLQEYIMSKAKSKKNVDNFLLTKLQSK